MIKVQEALKSIELAEETGSIQYLLDALNDCKTALSEIEKCYGGTTPVSEPVAWQGLGVCTLQKPVKDKHLFAPLYPSPHTGGLLPCQPREWVGLNEDEIVKIMDGTEFNEDNFCILEAAINYCRAIESALKQINTKG